ncbi:hypothetical protein P4B35_21295 [Pontiellaceae bacterium B12227]|nr:hypothetical protein [Pontiellaceae bacterium B12227]
MRIYHRNLPHWRQDRATYFVTFRLGDSIPQQKLLQWREEDQLWLEAHGVERCSAPFSCVGGNGAEHRSTELPEPLREEFVRRSARRLHVELDRCHGCCLFRRLEAREVLADALGHFHGSRWWVGDYVIMPNHVHLLAQPICGINGAEHRSTAARSSGPCGGAEENGAEHRSTELEDILASVKGFVSTRLSKLGFKEGKLWQQENYDRLVRDREELAVWRKYIRQNPEKAGLRAGQFSHLECEWL